MKKMAAILLLLLSCARAYDAEVWFSTAADIPAGTPVLLGAQMVGETKEPTVVTGRLRVPIKLRWPDALPDATIFVREVSGDRVVLVAHPRGNAMHLSAGRPHQFLGATSRVEYWRFLLSDTVDNIGR